MDAPMPLAQTTIPRSTTPAATALASGMAKSASEKALRYALELARLYESKLCLARVVSPLGPAIAGPGAIAACEEAVLREAAQLQTSLVRTGGLSGIQPRFIIRRGELWPE